MNLNQVKFAGPNNTFVLKNIACLVAMDGDEKDVESSRNLGVQHNVDVTVEEGKISAIGRGAGEVLAQKSGVEVFDARKWVVMPGLVDAHVHPLFAGNRAAETVMKAKGLSYEEIASRGGGIAVTTRATRAATSADLEESFLRRAHTALTRGVVLMDAKTGYGLSVSEEERHLKCLIDACARTQNRPHIAATLLGPHAASPDLSGLALYIAALVEGLPRFAEMGKEALKSGILAGIAADIFVERNYFSKEHGDRWLGAALQHGLDVHIHADEFSRSGGCELAVELATKLEQTAEQRRSRCRVLSVDHCQYATEADLLKLAANGVVATALPITSFLSNIPFVDGRKWRESRIKVAIASDFNPGSAPINNLWLAAHLALTRCGFTLPEVLRGVTTNAARALGLETEFGTLGVGKPAHIIAFQGEAPDDFFASPLGDHLDLVMKASRS